MTCYAHLFTTTNFTFLTGASHPAEYVMRAIELGYDALAITDECSLAGIVKAYACVKEYKKMSLFRNFKFKLIIGSYFHLSNGITIIALAPNREAYAELSGFITFTRRRSPKGEYEAHIEDLPFRLKSCLIIWVANTELAITQTRLEDTAKILNHGFKERLWLGINLQISGREEQNLKLWHTISLQFNIPLTACSNALMHHKGRKPLQDVLTGIKKNTPITQLGTLLQANAEAYLKSIDQLRGLYHENLLSETINIANQCHFCLSELSYQYPPELVPEKLTPIMYLRRLVTHGKHTRYPQGVPKEVDDLLEKELQLIEELQYEYFFLTVYDIVQFAQSQNILYQGRGSAANSVVCYCLFITNISPQKIKVLFERFISKERDEPPDIDVDFEHQRREEVIQYIYKKYSRERAALAATVITYRSRSAIRDVGKALGLAPSLIDHLAKSLAWWDRTKDLQKRIQTQGLEQENSMLEHFYELVQSILGFPRHLSQHVGGFIIAKDRVSDLVPLENASMPARTVIQWDKEDLETMGLLKVDILALGMLTALHKSLGYVAQYCPQLTSLNDIPEEDKATYEMLCQGDSIGVFQVESRAQMSMLPRLKPRTFYDLVIEIAIVRPGPIQGDMVHPYLRRRNGEEPVSYFNDDIKEVLESTLGIPIFQEQAIRLSMVAAGFSGGEADELRRSMASWGKNGNLLKFEKKFIQGMLANNYPLEFAHRLFEQIKGFGGYGFPESHSASFALLCYYSSWFKQHHPAAFYCALLNSQPMGFYTPSQLIQDALRHNVPVSPVDINKSVLENTLERSENGAQPKWGIRLGFIRVKSLAHEKAKVIVLKRENRPFKSIKDLAFRTQLTRTDLQHLAGADALQSIAGNRHFAHWSVSELQPFNAFLHDSETADNTAPGTPLPNIKENILNDYATTGLSLRPHPMHVLRHEEPFIRCQRASELNQLKHRRFVRVAGIVTGRQRPGTAKGTIFVTLEDETGNINIIVWKDTQNTFRKSLLTAKLLLVKGTLEVNRDSNNPRYSVTHVVAGQLIDYTYKLAEDFNLKSRDFH